MLKKKKVIINHFKTLVMFLDKGGKCMPTYWMQ